LIKSKKKKISGIFSKTFRIKIKILFIYSRRQGLQEDINDILREQAEKKKHLAPNTKRPKTAA